MDRQSKGEDGFGLIEAIVALVVLGVALTALLPALANTISINTTSDLRTGAVAVAQEVLDDLRSDGDNWPTSGTTTELDTGRAVYTYELEHEQYCEDGDCFDGARAVTIAVAHNGQVLYEVETIFTSLGSSGL